MSLPGERLIEREDALALLDRLVAGLAERRRPAVVRISGAPGTGRSSLLRHLAGLAERSGLPVAAAHCYPSDMARSAVVPQQVFADLGARPPDALQRAGGEQAAAQPLHRELLAAVGGGPLVLLVDDVHWCDPRSREWLHAIARAAREGPLLLALAETSGLSRLDPAGAQRVALAPLSPAGAAELVRRFGRPDAGAHALEAAVRAGRGIPAVLNAALLRLHGEPSWVERLPETCAELATRQLEHQVDGLPSDLRAVLRAVAAGDGRFTAEDLAELVGCTPAGTQGSLADLHAAGLLAADPAAGARVPEAVRQRILADMAADERSALFSQAAVRLYKSGTPDPATADLLRLAPPLGEPWVPDVLKSAAKQARAAGDRERAVSLLGRALREPLLPEQHAEVLVEIGATEPSGEPGAGDRHLCHVLTRSTGRRLRAHRVAAADLLLAGGNGRAAGRAIATVINRANTSAADRADLLGLYWLAAETAHGGAGFGTVPVPALGEACTHPVQAAAAAIRLAIREPQPERVRGLAQAALAAPPGAQPVLTARAAAVHALQLAGDLAGAEIHGDDLVAGAGRHRAPVLQSGALLARAQVRLATGALHGAAADLARANDTPGRCHPALRCYLAATGIMLDLELQRPDRAQSAAEHARDTDTAGTGFFGVYLAYASGRAALATGAHDRALAAFRECSRWLASHGWRNPEVLPWRTAAAQCLVGSGAEQAGRRLAEEEVAAAAQWGAVAAGNAHLRASRAFGPGSDATAHLERAVPLLAQGGARLQYARALTGLAAARLAERDRAAAAPLIGEASALADHHGWDLLAAQLQELSGEPGGTRPQARAGLSKMQRCVAELAAAGVPNARIADRLAVTKRTVELHLTNAYRALGISGREQLPSALGARPGTLPADP
ncbi:LuxR family transcriptional regulator [Streptomonospora sediminis]